MDAASPREPLSEHLREALGVDLVAFLSNDAPAGGFTRAAAEELKRYQQLAGVTGDGPTLVDTILRADLSGTPTAAWRIRQANGGELPAIEAEDEIGRVLATIAVDAYPALIGEVWTSSAFRLINHWPRLKELVDVHPSAQTLASLFSAAGLSGSEKLIAGAMIIDVAGDAANPGSVLSAAARRLRHRSDHGPAAFALEALTVLAQLTALNQGQPIVLNAYVGLSALNLEPGRSVELPQGVLRAPTLAERRFTPSQVEPQAVLVIPVECRPFAAGEDTGTPQVEGQLQIQRAATEIALAAALASEDDLPRFCPGTVWTVQDSFRLGGGTFWPHHPRVHMTRMEFVSDRELAGLADWAEKVHRTDLRKIDIAVERILRAVWEPDWIDSLIDAVIAWENMLGTRLETTYRVTAALAVLCEDDAEERLAVRKRLQAAYGARSRLVHGDARPDDLHVQHGLAVRTALEAMRRLIDRRPDLLELATSDKRADRLLLGIEPT